MVDGIDKSALEKELNESFNELDALTNRTEAARSHSAEDLWRTLNAQGVIATEADRINTEKYVKGNILLSEYLSSIQELHPEVGAENQAQ